MMLEVIIWVGTVGTGDDSHKVIVIVETLMVFCLCIKVFLKP